VGKILTIFAERKDKAMITAFYITSAVLVILLVSVTVKFATQGRDLDDPPFQIRRKAFVVFYIILVVNVALSLTIVHPQGVEVYSTLPICTLYFVFSAFMMMSTAHFGKDYYRNVFIWFLIMQYGFMLLGLSVLCRFFGLYEPMFTLDGMFDAHNHFIAYGRIYFLAIMLAVYFLMILVLAESYVSCRRRRKYETSEFNARPEYGAENLNILLYVVVFTAAMASYFIPSILPHIICNALLAAMAVRSSFTFSNYLNAMRGGIRAKKLYLEISGKLDKMLENEKDNPIYKSNTNIDDISEALQVSRDDMSNYIYQELGSSFAAWVCEKKLLRCARLIATTDRKISEIAINTGYMDLPAMSKAFKKRFGVTPSEYRKRNAP